MSLLALLAASAPIPPDPPGYDPSPDSTPYAFPATSPWNAPSPMPTPTPDSTGQATHPSVVDFWVQHGQATWNGWRFWMAITPYAGSNSAVEDPCILVSSDGYTWVVPAGLTNPIDQEDYPGGSYNSDTDLVFDPGTGWLWCFWREHHHSIDPDEEILHCAWSTDGITWTTVPRILVVVGQSGRFVSPSVARIDATTWRMVSIASNNSGGTSQLWGATSPTGPWTSLGTVTFTGAVIEPWHFGMHWDGTVYRGLIDVNGNPNQDVYAATSADGLSWQVDPAAVIVGPVEAWDERPYRACLTPRGDDLTMRVWYGASEPTSPSTWRTGYTHIPLTAWPAPPA